jgi:hypothetical protein
MKKTTKPQSKKAAAAAAAAAAATKYAARCEAARKAWITRRQPGHPRNPSESARIAWITRRAIADLDATN